MQPIDFFTIVISSIAILLSALTLYAKIGFSIRSDDKAENANRLAEKALTIATEGWYKDKGRPVIIGKHSIPHALIDPEKNYTWEDPPYLLLFDLKNLGISDAKITSCKMPEVYEQAKLIPRTQFSGGPDDLQPFDLPFTLKQNSFIRFQALTPLARHFFGPKNTNDELENALNKSITRLIIEVRYEILDSGSRFVSYLEYDQKTDGFTGDPVALD